MVDMTFDFKVSVHSLCVSGLKYAALLSVRAVPGLNQTPQSVCSVPA